MNLPLKRVTIARLRGIFWLPANLILMGEMVVKHGREPKEGDTVDYAEKHTRLKWFLWLMMISTAIDMLLLYHLQFGEKLLLSLAGALYGLITFLVAQARTDESFGEGKYRLHLLLAPLSGVFFALLAHLAALWLGSLLAGVFIVFIAYDIFWAIGVLKGRRPDENSG